LSCFRHLAEPRIDCREKDLATNCLSSSAIHWAGPEFGIARLHEPNLQRLAVSRLTWLPRRKYNSASRPDNRSEQKIFDGYPRASVTFVCKDVCRGNGPTMAPMTYVSDDPQPQRPCAHLSDPSRQAKLGRVLVKSTFLMFRGASESSGRKGVPMEPQDDLRPRAGRLVSARPLPQAERGRHSREDRNVVASVQ
jgi:hypothetical protein